MGRTAISFRRHGFEDCASSRQIDDRGSARTNRPRFHVPQTLFRSLAVAWLLVVLIGESSADVADWVLEAISGATIDPNEAYYASFVDTDCPVEDDDIDNIIEGELTRSRIKPLHWTLRTHDSESLIVFDVDLFCLDREDLNPIFNVDVYFALYIFYDDRFSGSVLIDWGFGAFGVGGRDYILQSVEDSVEDAITAYIRANFDL